MARQPLVVRSLTADEQTALEALYHRTLPPHHRALPPHARYHRTRDARLRTRAQMILLATEQHLVASEIAVLVRQCEQTVRNWIKRFNAEGLEGLKDQPRPGSPVKVTEANRARLLLVIRRRPRSASRIRSGRCSAWPTSARRVSGESTRGLITGRWMTWLVTGSTPS